MRAFKLFKKRKNGTLGPLFINRRLVIPKGKWLEAEAHRTKGFAFRPGWHCCSEPKAPHLTSTKENRVWCEVEIQGIEKLLRPIQQGGLWFLSKRLKLIREL